MIRFSLREARRTRARSTCTAEQVVLGRALALPLPHTRLRVGEGSRVHVCYGAFKGKG